MNTNMIFQSDSIVSRFGDIALLLLVIFLCYSLTDKYLSRYIKVNFSSGLERFVLLEAIGLGILAYITLILGLCGLLYQWIFWGLILVAVLSVTDRIKALFEMRGSVKIDLKLINENRLETVIIVMFAFFVLTSLIGALAPPISWDELQYHLAVPKIYLQHHRIFNVPTMTRSSLIMTQDMLFLFSMLIKSDILAKLFHFAMGILTSLAIYSFSRKYFSNRVALLSSLIFYSAPFVVWESTTAGVELGLTFFEVLAVFAVIKWLLTNENNELLLGAVFCGFAVGTKYLGVFSFLSIVIMILLGLAFSRKEAIQQLLKILTIFCILVALVSSIWYVKNYAFTQNPVFPYFNNVFRSALWYPALDYPEPGVAHASSMGNGIFDCLMLPWNLTFRQYPNKESQFGPIFFMFVPLLLLFFLLKKTRINDAARHMLIYSATLFFFMAVTTRIGRFFIPLLPFLSILTGSRNFFSVRIFQ